MKKIYISLSISLLLLASFSTVSIAQQTSRRSWGLSASFQQSELGVNIPFWLSEKFVLAPNLGIVSASEVATDITVGVTPKFYFNTKQLSPYLAIRVAGIFNSPAAESAENSTDILGGIAFGGEYFFVPSFSVAVEAQGNLTISDENSNRFGNAGGTNFNLATAITASIYFLRD